MGNWDQRPLAGAMTDPCPVCNLKPKNAVSTHGDATPDDGAITICFGCGLVQIIRNGMRCALQKGDCWVFDAPDMVVHLVALAKLRAMNPMRTGELVRQQAEEG